MLKYTVVFGIVSLIMFSSMSSLSIGYMDDISNNDVMSIMERHYNFYRYNKNYPETVYDLGALLNHYDFSKDIFSSDEISIGGRTHPESNYGTFNGKPIATRNDPMDSSWPMKCHDNRHTGRSPYSTAGNNGAELWKFKSISWIEDGMAIDDDGTIYFGDYWGYFYAISSDGLLEWEFKTGESITSCPAIAEDGTIYIGSWDHHLYALFPDGSLKWEVDVDETIASSPAIAADGTIYFGTMKGFDEGEIIAVNPDGTIKWVYSTGYYITSDPAIGADGTVYIGSGDTYFYALYPNGTLRWEFKTGHYIKGPPSIAEDGTIYIGSWDDYLYALNQDGSMKWKCKVGAGTETNPSIGPDGTIYVGGGHLWAIHPDGTLKWTFDLGENHHIHQSSPAVSADGIIYVGTNIVGGAGGDIIAVNPDGTERWRHRIANDWVNSAPCIDENGVVYIGSSRTDVINNVAESYGYLYAFGPGEVNYPPHAPSFTGPGSGKTGESYTYNISAVDPDGDDVYYYVDWGDMQIEEWIGPFASGEEITLSHTWSEQGTYTIKAKAKDSYDAESQWTTLEVTMPKNKQYSIFLLFEMLFAKRLSLFNFLDVR